MISKFEEIIEMFGKISERLTARIDIFVIGGAALMHYGLGKGYTKDIDIVLKAQDDLKVLSGALKRQGFVVKRKPLHHDPLEIYEMLEKDGFRFDLFVKRVVGDFVLSDTMAARATKILSLHNLNVHICSKEDIVIFKSVSPNRQNDVEDSIDLIKRGVDWDVIYGELLVQIEECNDKGKAKRLVWYFIERVNDLEGKGAIVPIKRKVIDLYNSL
jgi:hypothetical protein